MNSTTPKFEVDLQLGTDALRVALHHGVLQQEAKRLHVAPLALHTRDGDRYVRFAVLSGVAQGGLKAWFQAARAISLTATAAPAAVVWMLGKWAGLPVHGAHALCALLGAVCLQVAVNFLNDVEDHERLIDLPGTMGGAGVIQSGRLSAASVQRGGYLMVVAGIALGLPAVLATPGPLLAVGLAGVVGALGYSGWPFSLKYRALGDVAVALLCGPVLTAGFALAAFRTVPEFAYWVGGAFGALAVGILHVNNTADVVNDGARGSRTLPMLLGDAGSRGLLFILYPAALLSWAATAHAVALPIWVYIAPVLMAPLGLRVLRPAMTPRGLEQPSEAGLRYTAAQAHLAFGVVALVATGAALALR